MKSRFWQVQISEEDKYKTTFTTPFGHYEWNVMPFGLKNALSEFQNIMNDIFNSFSHFTIVYIDDVLIYSIYIYIYAMPQYLKLKLIYHIYQSRHIGLLHNSSKTKLCRKIIAEF